jgi:DNA-binding CsgD family transcriptional regulator
MTYLDAIHAAVFAGCFAAPGADVAAAAEAALDGPQPGTTSPAFDDILDGLIANLSQADTPLPKVVHAMRKLGNPCAFAYPSTRWLSLASVAAIGVWDDRRWADLADRHVKLCRQEGAVTEQPIALSSRTYLLLFRGELAAATSVVEELWAASKAVGNDLALARFATLALAAFAGRAEEVSTLLTAALRAAEQCGQGAGIPMAEWACALLNNGCGNHQAALAAAQRAIEYNEDLYWRNFALTELVEAAVRSGEHDSAKTAYALLTETTAGSGTDWARGIQARSAALLASGPEAEDLYKESIERLGGASVRAELARAHLLYGEWLRREGRRGDARVQLRIAHTMLEQMGMVAFAERARRELSATGESVRKRAVAEPGELTPQELHIAKLARGGLTNPEIGGRLFISARTVEYHLSKVFSKLGISSRAQLDHALN